MFVEKVVEMAVLFGPETALNHLAKRIGDGPITTVDTETVADISETAEVSSDIADSTDGFHDVVSDSIPESLDVTSSEEVELMETLEVDFEDTKKFDLTE